LRSAFCSAAAAASRISDLPSSVLGAVVHATSIDEQARPAAAMNRIKGSPFVGGFDLPSGTDPKPGEDNAIEHTLGIVHGLS
jgi:hypothetical protein